MSNYYYSRSTTRSLTTRTTTTNAHRTGYLSSRSLVTGGFVAHGSLDENDDNNRNNNNNVIYASGKHGDTGENPPIAKKEEEPIEPVPIVVPRPEAPVASVSNASSIRVAWHNPDPAVVVGFKLLVSGGKGKNNDFSTVAYHAEKDCRTEYTVSSLDPGTMYFFKVIAISGDGTESEPSEKSNPKATMSTAETLPNGGLPDAPKPPVVFAIGSGTGFSNTSVKLRWSKPKSEGANPVCGYKVESRDFDSESMDRRTLTGWTSRYDERVDRSTTTVITGLDPTKTYQFRVAAYNDIGLGTFSTFHGDVSADARDKSDDKTSGDGKSDDAKAPAAGDDKGDDVVPLVGHRMTPPDAIDDRTAPEPPEAPVAGDATSKTVLLKWLPPARNGGAEITGYRVYDQRGRCVHDGSSSTKTECVVSQLESDKEYAFRVAAINAVAEGPASEPSAGVRTERDMADQAPSEPAGISVASVGEKHAALEWSPPPSGSEPTGYRVYKKELTAKTPGGDPASDNPPERSRDPVGNYKVAYDGAGKAATAVTVRNLKPGTVYRFRVSAQTSAGGEGPLSAATEAVTTGTCSPGVPEMIRPPSADGSVADAAAQGGDGNKDGNGGGIDASSEMLLRWMIPKDTGGFPPEELSYVVYRSNHEGEPGLKEAVDTIAETRPVGDDITESASLPPREPGEERAIVVGLRGDTEYRIKVSAMNEKGEGPASAAIIHRTKGISESKKKEIAEKAERERLEKEAAAKAEADRISEEKARKQKLQEEAKAKLSGARPVVGAIIEDEKGFDRIEIVTCKEGGAFHHAKVPDGVCCTKVAGVVVPSNDSFKKEVAKHTPGDVVEFTFIWKEDVEKEIPMKVVIGGAGIPIAEVERLSKLARGEFEEK